MNFGRLFTRIVVGGIFVGHGTQKLFGWFGGPGIEGTAKMMGSLELHPPRRNAIAASVAETAGGAMLVLGALTPLAAAAVTGTMITAIRTVHWKNGPWNANKGYEFNLTLIAATLAIVDAGPGAPSVDHALSLDDAGPGWALASLAAGAVGSTLAIEAGRRLSTPRKPELQVVDPPAGDSPPPAYPQQPLAA
jgi:putative oxidoreductase